MIPIDILRQQIRAEIEAGALAARGLELAWALDPVDLFFLQIQGSGVLRFADGSVQRIGYAGQNGRPYVAIGRLLKQRGLLERADMAAIIGWLRADPAAGAALMRENPSYVFFRTQDGPGGPPGALGVPLAAMANAAVDPAVIPLGAPLFARIEAATVPDPLLLVAADTGGAIRGANRIDVFFGRGREAGAIAGALSAPLDLWLLLPRPAADRLTARR
jgi:membrane-bound lytic murein transglycosylase A